MRIIRDGNTYPIVAEYLSPEEIDNILDYLIEENYARGGTQIASVPTHADDINHPDVEFGFITSFNGDVAYCRYWRKDMAGLRTTANSESTPIDCLRVYESVSEDVLRQAVELFRISIE